MSLILPQKTENEIARDKYLAQHKSIRNPHSLEIAPNARREKVWGLLRPVLEEFGGTGRPLFMAGDMDKDELRCKRVEALIRELLGDDFDWEVLT